jgi:hypothetical protein
MELSDMKAERTPSRVTNTPAERLEEQFRIRYQALEKMFSLCAQQEVSPKQRFDATVPVPRLAGAGQLVMMGLYNQIVDRDFNIGALPLERACTSRCWRN